METHLVVLSSPDQNSRHSMDSGSHVVIFTKAWRRPRSIRCTLTTQHFRGTFRFQHSRRFHLTNVFGIPTKSTQLKSNIVLDYWTWFLVGPQALRISFGRLTASRHSYEHIECDDLINALCSLLWRSLAKIVPVPALVFSKDAKGGAKYCKNFKKAITKLPFGDYGDFRSLDDFNGFHLALVGKIWQDQ